MKYFADLENLSTELKQKSSNLEEYLYGVDPRCSARWNEILFLLELCREALSPSAGHADNNILSHNPLPDTQRIRAIETLIGSLLVDELFLDEPDTFASIYALRPSSHGPQHFSSDFRRDSLQQLYSILGRDSTNMEYFNSTHDHDLDTRELVASSSRFYLLYLALGEPSDLKNTIEIFRKQKLPEVTLGSSNIPPTEELEVARQSSPSGRLHGTLRLSRYSSNFIDRDLRSEQREAGYVAQSYVFSGTLYSSPDSPFSHKHSKGNHRRPVVYNSPPQAPYHAVPAQYVLPQRHLTMHGAPIFNRSLPRLLRFPRCLLLKRASPTQNREEASICKATYNNTSASDHQVTFAVFAPAQSNFFVPELTMSLYNFFLHKYLPCSVNSM